MSIQDYDDRNPFIVYDNVWTVGDPSSGDGEKAKYYQQTWTMTIIDGACAEIRWQGSDITVWGSRRFNHGYYSVSIDSSPKAYFNGYAQPGDWSTPVISTFADNPKSYKPLVGVKEGGHSMKLCNEVKYQPFAGDGYFDIDKIQIRGTLTDARAPGAAPPAPSPSSTVPARASSASPLPSPIESSSPSQSATPSQLSTPASANTPPAEQVTTTATTTSTSLVPMPNSSSTTVIMPASTPVKALNAPTASRNGTISSQGGAGSGGYGTTVIATGTDQVPRLTNSMPAQGDSLSSSSFSAAGSTTVIAPIPALAVHFVLGWTLAYMLLNRSGLWR